MVLYSLWLGLAGVSGFLAFVGIGRLLSDSQRADAGDIVLLVIAAVVNVVTGATASSVDFACTGGAFCVNGVQPYTGDWEFIFVFIPIGIVCALFTLVAIVKTIQAKNYLKSIGATTD